MDAEQFELCKEKQRKRQQRKAASGEGHRNGRGSRVRKGARGKRLLKANTSASRRQLRRAAAKRDTPV
eukprot:CAMPEP_0114621956 /NCGR_PEP_ID=MMETSP0168-20121206/9490_1 /TAXON_ID=95228 ORGANISM="Vannella sp., Strain DIVA3 517/6/12" /NCGR_SAMPLE_ID=MMETSP0168 /ASSEMBLY_ACC=CAM_ASM_000044 /LENGTH=67 /DNA_ID=CAMNT_0001833159 /DNA_START=347 /DNA_END=550 /DNA_ORIENTATION=+